MGPPLTGQKWLAGLCLTVACVLGGEHGRAEAADWTITSTLSETASATDNVNFDIEDRTPALGSDTSIGLNILAHSHLYDFNLAGSWGYQVYFGENQDVPDPQYIPSLSANYVRRAKDLTFVVGASYVYSPGEDLRGVRIIPGQDGEGQNGEPGQDTVVIDTSNSNADQQAMSANTSVIYKINNTNDLNWSANATRLDFFGDNADNATPSTSAGTSLTWTNNRTRRVDLNISTGVDWYKYENDQNQVEYVYFLTGGFSNRVTPRLTINGNLGVQLLDSYQDEAIDPLLPDDTKHDHKTDLGGTGSLYFTYLLKTGGITGGISYGLSPDMDGELSNALTTTLGYNLIINDRSSFNIAAAFQVSDSDVDGVLSNTNFSISPSYTYALSRYWNLGMNYTFTYQDDENGVATENSAYLTLTRSYTILP